MATKEIPQNKSFEWTNLQFGRWLSSPPPGEEVVISGISGRLPDSNNIYEFQKHLFNKEEMVTDDGRRWKLDHPEIPQRTAKIYDVDKFDPGFFGIHHRQSEFMDSMMRTLLETATETVMDAGINPIELEGSRTGVFISVSWSDAENLTLVNVTDPQMFSMTGYLRSMAANRISYFLKLKGPSYIIDTACSSSMNAFAEAFKAIRSGQCDNAIVGAANLLIHPGNSLQFFRLGVLSSDGVCKVFDQTADGYVRGETIGCIFLQRAKNARRIYAQVINAKVNSDGFKEQGITFPSTISQKHLMTEIYEESRVHPSELSFLEAHGTGTQVGDPQEVEAIDEALAKKRKKPLLVGSVKCSIGHTEPASGICSIAKVLIAMETGLITPNINLKKIKEGMKGMEEGRMKVVTELTKLEGEEAIIGINNFGFGGNNCHAILRRFKKQKINNSLPGDDIPRLVCVSARTEEAILGMLDDLNRKPLDNDYIGLLHQMFKYDINNHLYRGYTILSKNGPIKTSFKFFNQIKTPVYVFFGSFENRFKELGRNLLEFPVFKNTISKINKCLNNEVDIETIILEKDKTNKRLGAIAVQIGFVELLKSLELHPNAVYGDAAGKLISAYYYNACTLEDVISTVFKMAQQPPQIISDIHFESIWAKLNDSIKRKMQNDDLNYFETSFKTKSQLNGDSFDYECLYYPPKNSTVLNVSDQHLNNKDVLIGEQNMIQFLETLGRLYEKGHTPHIHKLYPEVQYPVSRGTPLISPLVRWNHNKKWHIYKFDQFTISDAEQMEYNISFLHDEFKFIGGHVIDGRNLFPATQYLNLVWQTYAQSRRKLIMDTPVVFENCKFIRAVTMPKSGFVKLLVNIQQGSGNFEVLEKNSVVVSGRIHSPKDISQYQTELPPIPLLDDPTLIMEQDEIYRELYLRGYNYSDLFKGIVRCNLDSSCGLVKWEDNWCTFMDKMLQMKILQGDTRLLYVPVGIKKLTIDPLKHMDFTQNKEDDVLPVHVYKECNIIKSGGIEVCGLQAKSISKRKPMGEPVLEKHQFISNQAKLDLQTAVRINIQIVLENSLENNFKAVEVLDSSSENDVKYLLPLVSQVLEDVPSVNPDLTISTKVTLEEIPGVKIEDFVLTPESKVLLITGTNLLQRSTLKPIFDALSHHGFVMTKEKIDFTSELIEDIEIMTEYLTEDERLILFRKKTETYSNPICLTISSQHFDWIPELQQALKQDSNVVVYSQNEKLNGILGLVNCIRREPGGNKVKCFFMMEEAPEFNPQNPFYREQLKKNLGVNIYKDSQWGTYRHLLLEDLKTVETEHCFGNTLVRGDLSSLKWVEGSLTEKTKLQEHELLVYNYYSSINFKDIMAASGRISVDVIASDRTEQECVLGFEYSGKDSNGRRITGMTDRQALASLVVADSNFLWRVPDSWSLEDAATVPVVYSTVMYSLLVMINLKPGTKVLIHSATGGIGIAALNVCIYHRCEIFVTVGTQEKRDYLKKHYPQIADDHVGNSRDTSFEEMVKTVTRGRGVDVVLNSLTDDKLKASVRCLARGGHLMEIGKFDLANDTELDLLLLERGVNYHGVMLDQIFKSSELIKAKLVKLIYDGMDAGFVKPLPRTVFEQNDLEAAYRFMTHGKHIGKVMVKMRDEEEQKDAKPTRKLFKAVSRFNCDSEKTYVIIGGLGGVGLELADWLILRNAKKLILVSSSGIRSGYQTQRIRIWKSYGVHIQISKQDITTKEGCEALIKEAKALGSVEAIFNLAVVLKDALFEDQNEEKFRISLAPKAYATIYLDQVTREVCPELRYFVIFSSVSCGRGNAGQTNYGMANSIMERICEQRKKDGLPALAIQWGAIGDVGLVAKMQKENKELVIGGTLQQKISSCMEVMDTFLKQENPVVASMVVAEKHSRLSGALSAVDAVASLIGIKDLKTISQHATLAELGMDSMMGTEVMQILEKEFEIYITAKDVRSLTFAKLNELEEERKNTLEEKTLSKTSKGTDILLQDIPDSKTSEVPIIRLVSSVKPEDEAMTVFVLPGIEGVFKPLESFIKNIKAHVLGLQYSYRNPENSVEETAKAILPHFEKELTGKTFHLIGYSFGVVVALELVNMLEQKGYKGNVIFIDGSPAYLKASAKEYLPGETDPEIETILLQKILRVLLPIDVLEHSQEKFLKCGSFDERMNFALSLVPLDVAHLQKLEKQAAITLYTRFKSVLKYKFLHEKIKSSVHLFKARFPMVNTMDEQYMLTEVCENPVTVSVLDGDHLTILNQKNLVETVNKWLH